MRKEKTFLFHFKIFVLEKIKVKNFRHSNFMTSSNAQASNKKHVLLNDLRSKHRLLMKFSQFKSYYKSKKLKLVPGLFVFAKN